MSEKLKKIRDWLLEDDSDEEMEFECDSIEMTVAMVGLFVSLVALFNRYLTLSVLFGLGSITIIYLSLTEDSQENLNDK